MISLDNRPSLSNRVSARNSLKIMLGVVLVLNVLMLAAAHGNWHKFGLYATLNFFRLLCHQDSWAPMAQTYAYLVTPHSVTAYTHVFFDQKTKFIYPLSSLLIYVPTHGHLPVIVPIVLSWVFIWAGLAASLGIYRLAQGKSAAETTQERRTELVLLAALGLIFYPTMQGFYTGQIQVWINAFVAIAFWYWMQKRPGVAGMLIGLACLIKPQYAIILLWALLRKQGKLAVGIGATLGLGLLASLLIFGVPENLGYLSVVHYVAARGEAYYPNQTFNGLLNRAFFTGDSSTWSMHIYPTPNPWVFYGTTFTSVLLIGAALFWPRRTEEQGQVADLMTVTLSATMASPIAWEHHYGILLPIYALLLPRLRQNPVWGRATLPLLAVSYALTGVYLSVFDRLSNTSFNLLQSYLLFGALLALGLLYRLQALPAHAPAEHETNEFGPSSARYRT